MLIILVSISMAILGAHIGIWLSENFSIKKIFNKKQHKYLL